MRADFRKRFSEFFTTWQDNSGTAALNSSKVKNRPPSISFSLTQSLIDISILIVCQVISFRLPTNVFGCSYCIILFKHSSRPTLENPQSVAKWHRHNLSPSLPPRISNQSPTTIPNLPRNLPRKLPRNLSLHFLLRQAYTVKHIRKCVE